MLSTAALLLLALSAAPTPSSSLYAGIRNTDTWTGADFRTAAAARVLDHDLLDVVVLDGSQLVLVPGPAAYFGRVGFGAPATAFAVLDGPTPADTQRIVSARATGLELSAWFGNGIVSAPISGSSELGAAPELATWPGDDELVVGLRANGETLQAGRLIAGAFASEHKLDVAGLREWTLVDWDGAGDPELATLDAVGLCIRDLAGTVLVGPIVAPSTRPRLHRVPGAAASFDRLLWIVDDPLAPATDYGALLDQRYPTLEVGYPLGFQLGNVAIADLGGDGADDLWVFGSQVPNVWIAHHDTTAPFPQQSYHLPDAGTILVPIDHGPGYAAPVVVTADFDRDGDEDLWLASDAYEHAEFVRSDWIPEHESMPTVLGAVQDLDESTTTLQLDVIAVDTLPLRPLAPLETTASATHVELVLFERLAVGAPVDSQPVGTWLEPLTGDPVTVTAQWTPTAGAASWPLTLRLVREQGGVRTHAGPHLIYEYTNDPALTILYAAEPTPWGPASLPVTELLDPGSQIDPGAGLHQRPNIMPYQP